MSKENDPFLRSMARFGFDDEAEAIRAATATLSALRAGLTDDDAAALAQELSEPYAAALRSGAHEGPLDVEQLRERVQRIEGVHAGRAVEHLQVVCRAMGEALGDDAIARLRARLPAALAAEMERPAPSMPPRSHARAAALEEAPGEGHTLATGRPGSRHPLSEAAPPGAHAHSVVRSTNPHADTKLSSARGLTQERLEETLATGRSGPEQTLAGEGGRS